MHSVVLSFQSVRTNRVQVKATMSRFEERVFGLLRGFMALGAGDPALLVAVIRIVEMQEHVDRQILASAHGAALTWVLNVDLQESDMFEGVYAGTRPPC
jgi:hypothetical protein